MESTLSLNADREHDFSEFGDDGDFSLEQQVIAKHDKGRSNSTLLTTICGETYEIRTLEETPASPLVPGVEEDATFGSEYSKEKVENWLQKNEMRLLSLSDEEDFDNHDQTQTVTSNNLEDSPASPIKPRSPIQAEEKDWYYCEEPYPTTQSQDILFFNNPYLQFGTPRISGRPDTGTYYFNFNQGTWGELNMATIFHH